jgi:general secretion pathway protein G
MAQHKSPSLIYSHSAVYNTVKVDMNSYTHKCHSPKHSTDKCGLHKRDSHKGDNRKSLGFTLVELLIVMVILGLLSAIVAPRMFSKVSSAKVGTAKAQMQVLSTALDSYRLDIGYYPDSLAQLISSDDESWDGPYFPQAIPLDPWKHAYQYSRTSNDKTGEDFLLKSFGRDKKLGGEGEDADVEL